MITRAKFDALREALGGISADALRRALKKAGVAVIPKGQSPVRIEVKIKGGVCEPELSIDKRKIVIDCEVEYEEPEQPAGEG